MLPGSVHRSIFWFPSQLWVNFLDHLWELWPNFPWAEVVIPDRHGLLGCGEEQSGFWQSYSRLQSCPNMGRGAGGDRINEPRVYSSRPSCELRHTDILPIGGFKKNKRLNRPVESFRRHNHLCCLVTTGTLLRVTDISFYLFFNRDC